MSACPESGTRNRALAGSADPSHQFKMSIGSGLRNRRHRAVPGLAILQDQPACLQASQTLATGEQNNIMPRVQQPARLVTADHTHPEHKDPYQLTSLPTRRRRSPGNRTESHWHRPIAAKLTARSALTRIPDCRVATVVVQV